MARSAHGRCSTRMTERHRGAAPSPPRGGMLSGAQSHSQAARYAAAAIERDVHNGANVCAARALWCAEARIGDARWCRVVDGPQETLRDILEAALCH